MQNIKRPNNAPMGLAFLFLSLAILPVSLKATGFDLELNPRLGNVLDAWGQIASVFRSGDQPITAAKLSALNFVEKAPAELDSPATCSTQIAQASEGEEVSASACAEPEARAAAALPQQARSAHAKGRSAATARRVMIALAAGTAPEVSLSLNQRMEVVRAIHSIVPIQDKILKTIERDLSRYDVEVAKALKTRMRKIAKAQPKTAPSAMIDCDLRDCDFRLLTLPRRDLPPRTVRVRVADEAESMATGESQI